MNKLAVVLGVAAVATLAGCKDPEYARIRPAAQDEAKSAETEPAEEQKAEEAKADVKHCKCAPGTKHDKACECGAEDCQCIVETKQEAKHCKCAPGTKHDKPCECGADDCQCVVEAKAVEPEYTIYIVQKGDYLAKISKKFNIKVDAIKKLNNMKNESVRLGQKIKLPGKVDVGEQKVPEGAIKKTPAKKYESYKGETKEYVVKSGDTLGKIAYSNGMNIRQLKELNGLTKDTVRVGQKLKVAAKAEEKSAEPKTEKKTEAKVEKKDEAKPVEQPKAEEKAAAPAPAAEKQEAAPAAETKAEAAPAANAKAEAAAPAAKAADGAATDYIVQEGDDLPNIAIEFQVPVARLRELNNLGEGDEVKAGQVLKIPAAQ